MAFRLREAADEWFKHVFKKDSPIQTKFDLYYFCLMLGLATGKLEKPQDAPEIVEAFVTEYKPVQRLIIGLLLVAELHRLGTDLADKKALQELMNDYLEPSNPASLSTAGFSRLNDYASGGFSYLAQQMQEKPHHVEDFLLFYGRLISDAIHHSELWTRYSSAA